MSDLINRHDTLKRLCEKCTEGQERAECGKWKCMDYQVIKYMPSAQPEWNNHIVACLLAELFDDTCACNYNGIDEWLPSKCELTDSCPNPVGVACWEQYLTHKAERITDE